MTKWSLTHKQKIEDHEKRLAALEAAARRPPWEITRLDDGHVDLACGKPCMVNGETRRLVSEAAVKKSVVESIYADRRPASEEKPPPCPRCGSGEAVSSPSGVQWECPVCGHRWSKCPGRDALAPDAAEFAEKVVANIDALVVEKADLEKRLKAVEAAAKPHPHDCGTVKLIMDDSETCTWIVASELAALRAAKEAAERAAAMYAEKARKHSKHAEDNQASADTLVDLACGKPCMVNGETRRLVSEAEDQKRRAAVERLQDAMRRTIGSLDELWALPHRDMRVRDDIQRINKFLEAALTQQSNSVWTVEQTAKTGGD